MGGTWAGGVDVDRWVPAISTEGKPSKQLNISAPNKSKNRIRDRDGEEDRESGRGGGRGKVRENYWTHS